MRHLTHLNYIDVVAKEGSIRKAADKLAITSTALNRRILALEEEIGSPLFERLPSGVRLNTAGELFIQHLRYQIQDLSRVLSQIADLSGVRRGHVSLSISPEFSGQFLAAEIARYRYEHGGVSFDILTQTPEKSITALTRYESDIALIYGAVVESEITLSATLPQLPVAQMAPSHPLAGRTQLSLEDIFQYPVIMPKPETGLHAQIMMGCARKSLHVPAMIVADNFAFFEDYLIHEHAIGFNIPLTANNAADSSTPATTITIPLKSGECPQSVAHIAYLKGRTLPVAGARFLDQLVTHIHHLFPDQTN